MPGAWGRSLRLPVQRSGLAVVALVLLAALYAWPVLADPSSSAGERVDRFLRLAAVTAVAVACLAASWRTQGRVRSALLVLVAGAQLWSVAQSVLLAGDVLGRGAPAPAVDALGVLALTACATAALWLLSAPRTRAEQVRLLVEWSLLTASVVLLLRFALPAFWQAGQAGPDWARAAGVGALLAAALLLAVGRGAGDVRWSRLAVGLAGVAVALAAVASTATGPGARLAGLLLAGSLVVVALVVAPGPDDSTHDATDDSTDDGTHDGTAPAGSDAVRRARLAAAVWVLPCAAGVAVVVRLLDRRAVDVLAVGGLLVVGLLAVAHGHVLRLQGRNELTELHAREEGLRHRAFHDDLTGLANRALFLDSLTRALDLHRRHRLAVSVLYLDLDGFKDVNDRHGHAVGDAVLAALAERLRLCVRPEDTLARLGGDEFALLLEHASSSDAVEERLREVLQEPFLLGGLRFVLQMSVGSVRVEPADPTPLPEEVLARADAAMYARKTGRATAGARSPEVPPDADLAEALAVGIAAGELSLVHQPLVDAATGEVHGTEVLARWRHDGRLLLPASFVELADRAGLSRALLDAVLAQACSQLGSWSRAAGHHRLSVWVNVSPVQLASPDLADRVGAAVRSAGLAPHQVVLETSVAAVTGPDRAVLLRPDGPSLALTGFTGAADQLALLRCPAVRAVKVSSAHLFDQDRRLHVLAALAAALGVRVVVERVQRPDELSALRALDGVLGQGYALSRPAVAGDLDPVVLGRTPLLV